MTQCENLLQMFRENGGRIRRNDLLQSGFLGASYRQRLSDIRKLGYVVECQEIDGDTVFVLKGEPPMFEGNQVVML